jgi:hypothetical protein
MELKKTGKVQNKQAANLNSVVHINVILPAILKWDQLWKLAES